MAVLELLTTTVIIDVISDSYVPTEWKEPVVEWIARGLAVLVLAVCLLIAALVRGGVMVER